LLVLLAQPREFDAFCVCEAVAAAALVAIGLRDPVADRLRRWLELFRQVFRRAAGANQFDQLPPELRRVWGTFLRHRGLLKHKCFGVHESGGTSDRGYLDFERLARLDDAGSFFVTRAKSNTQVRRRYSRYVDRSTGLVCDQTVVLTGYYTRKGFDSPLRRVKFNDPETGKTLVFLSNNFALPAMTIAKLYKYRWRVELFFKWIKQHLRIKAFFGESENAVKTQIWSAVCVYVLVAIVKKRLAIKASLYEMLQILSLTLFEKTQLLSLFVDIPSENPDPFANNQLNLFD
jgi:DDE family transposase